MIQLALTIYGIVALVRGKFSVGRDKQIVGSRARILGGICAASLPAAFAIGLTIGILAGMGLFPMPGHGAMLIFDWMIVILTIVAVYTLGNRFYRQQVEESFSAEAQPLATPAPQYYAVVDPTNPFASPSVKD